jgi:Ca2+-binding EF-hand superfamily protein
MGEVFTELELDEMLELANQSGQGRIAFFEFYQVIKHPEPTSTSFVLQPESNYKNRDWFAEGAVRGLFKEDKATAAAAAAAAAALLESRAANVVHTATKKREHDIRKKVEKRTESERAVGALGLRLQELTKAFRRFQRHESFEDGEASMEELCEIFDVDASTHMTQLFNAYRMNASSNQINVRDLLLGLANFVGATRPQRINFCFYLFDLDNSDTLSKDELVAVIKGSNLAGSILDVRAKADAIFKTVVTNPAQNSIDLEQFLVAAHRFPNVLFPSFEDRDATGARRKVTLPDKELEDVRDEEARVKHRRDDKNNMRGQGKTTTLSFPIPGVTSSSPVLVVDSPTVSPRGRVVTSTETVMGAATDAATPL